MHRRQHSPRRRIEEIRIVEKEDRARPRLDALRELFRKHGNADIAPGLARCQASLEVQDRERPLLHRPSSSKHQDGAACILESVRDLANRGASAAALWPGKGHAAASFNGPERRARLGGTDEVL